MDNEPAHSPLAPEPSDRRVLFSAIAWVGVIFMFIFIVLVTYVPNRSSDLDAKNVEARMAIKNIVDAQQAKKATTYEWIDQSKGLVRLPIERARELVVNELKTSSSGD